MKRIAIVGGGVAGLAAAYELSQNRDSGEPVKVSLFEASSRLGGIVETHREGGFVIEGGPDGWVTEKPWARELAEELGLAAEILFSNDSRRRTYVLIDGRLEAIPASMRMMVPADLEALESSALFSAEAREAYRREPARAAELKAAAPVEDESVAEFVRRHFGEEVLATVGAPLLRGIFGGDVERLSVRAVMAPFVAMERAHGSLVAGVQSRGASSEGAALFTTLRTGLGTLIDRMVASIPQEWIHLGNEVMGISRRRISGLEDRWVLETSAGREECDALMLAAPVHVSRALLRPVDARAAELMEMEASSAVVVGLGFANAGSLPLPEGFGFLVPTEAKRMLMACTFMEQKFNDRVPEGGKLLRAFFGGEAAERMAKCGNDEIVSIARQELARILGPLPEPAMAVVRRWPLSLPQYAVGHLERMAELEERVRRLGGLWLLGNGYRGVGLPDLIRDARSAARIAVGRDQPPPPK